MKPHPAAPDSMSVSVTPNGPYEVKGNIPLQLMTIGTNDAGDSIEWVPGKIFESKSDPVYLCRCGHSAHKPFCDKSHLNIPFNGATNPHHRSYLQQAGLMEGPDTLLTDAENLCAFARFCDPNGQVWNMIEHTDDPTVKKQFLKQVHQCPSGRLMAWDKETQTPIEPELPPAIGVVEDPSKNISGPYYVQGGITIHNEKGTPYEIRNRVTLCRCGASRNKPFCDGSHAAIQFKDNLQP